MSKYLCQGCEFNSLGWCKKHRIDDLKSKRIKECKSFRKSTMKCLEVKTYAEKNMS